jgi:hypothetical protein
LPKAIIKSMNFIRKIFETIFLLIYIVNKIGIQRLIKFKSPNADVIVWMYPRFPKQLGKYLRGGSIIQDTATINALIENQIHFSIKLGKRIGACKNKIIFFVPSTDLNFFSIENYSSTIVDLVIQLQIQKNIVFPNVDTVKFWENKAYMHQKFDELGIRSPTTFLIKCIDEMEKYNLSFPCLIKEVHSAGSVGVHKVNTKQEAFEVANKLFEEGHEVIIVQQLLNMRRDIRVVVVNNEVVLHYWRINNSKDWKPTSTSHGSNVDFDYIPNNLAEELIQKTKQLGLVTAGFDVAYDNDDMNSEPYILEVSPSYQLNPPLPLKFKNIPYYSYKKIVFDKEAYYKEYVNITFKVKAKIVHSFLKSIQKIK